MGNATDRQQFRALVAEVAARAKGLLPQEVNGRLEGAVRLVLLDEVQPQADGTVLVGSCSDPTKTYRLVGQTCECKDYTDGKAPSGWCRHRISAGIHKRVQELTAPAEEDIRAGTNISPALPPLPEAPVSITLKATLHGHEVLVTLRGHDFASVQAQVEQASQWLRSQQPAEAPRSPQAPSEPEQRYCPRHGTAMQINHKEGRSWYSHRTEDGHFCKGK